MKTLEFRTRITNNGVIFIPEHIKDQIRPGTLVEVAIFDDGVNEYNGTLINVGKTRDERKEFWDRYQINELWNGE